MEFAYPEAFAGLAAIPLLFLFNLWKYRRLRVRVGSLIIWKRLSRHAETPPSSKQCYFNLSLLVQIVVIVLLTTAIAGPRAKQVHSASRIIHLLIDRSASTQARSAGQGPGMVFERITKGAFSLLEKLQATDRVYCHSFPGISNLESSGPLTPDEARDWLSGLKPTQLRGDPSIAALEVAARAATTGSQVFFFTDQPPGGLPSSVRVIAAAADTSNVAITAVKAAGGPDGLHLFFRITNFASTRRTARWAVSGAGGTQHDSSGQDGPSIPPGESVAINRLLGPGAASEEVLEVRLLRRDALACDNSAYVSLNPAAKMQISCIGEQDTRLLRVLTALPGATVVLPEAPTSDCDIALFNEVSPAELPDCHAVVIAPPAGIPGLVMTDRNEVYTPTGPLRTQAPEFMPKADWAGMVKVDKALRPVLIRRRGASTILADANNTPLIVLFSLEGRKVLYVGFRLCDTRWPEQVSFPLFWGLLTERMGARERAAWITIITGAPVELPAHGLTTITSPSGEQLSPGRSSTRVLLTPDSVGIYRAQYPDGPKLLGVSLLAPGESKLSDADTPFDDSMLAAATGAKVSSVNWLWQYFAFIGALAMLTSWIIWQERKKD